MGHVNVLYRYHPGVAALNSVGWLSYVRQLNETLEPTWVSFILGMVSSCIDNNLLEARTIMSNPSLGVDQWMLNAMMVSIGSLTVVGSSAGVMVMSIDKRYTFVTHLRFLPAVLANFLGSFAFWYLQFEVLHWI